MYKITKKKHLEMILENVPKHPNPKVELEQYSTPATIAADLVWNAYSLGDIEGLDIIDLGCGCGILGFASCLLGAKSCLGIDIDKESIDLAKKTSENISIKNANFITADINQFKSINELLNKTELENRYFTNENIEENTYQQQIRTQDEFKVGTLIQNPPFGSQEKGKRNADRNFMKFAVNSAEVIYSFHMANTEEFVIDYYRNLGAEVSHKLVYKFPIPKIYDFHKEESRDVKIVVLRVENFNE